MIMINIDSTQQYSKRKNAIKESIAHLASVKECVMMVMMTSTTDNAMETDTKTVKKKNEIRKKTKRETMRWFSGCNADKRLWQWILNGFGELQKHSIHTVITTDAGADARRRRCCCCYCIDSRRANKFTATLQIIIFRITRNAHFWGQPQRGTHELNEYMQNSFRAKCDRLKSIDFVRWSKI